MSKNSVVAYSLFSGYHPVSGARKFTYRLTGPITSRRISMAEMGQVLPNLLTLLFTFAVTSSRAKIQLEAQAVSVDLTYDSGLGKIQEASIIPKDSHYQMCLGHMNLHLTLSAVRAYYKSFMNRSRSPGDSLRSTLMHYREAIDIAVTPRHSVALLDIFMSIKCRRNQT
jgi:hypothetical protein